MRIGLYLRNMGPHATRGVLLDCARAADELPIDDLWVFDHLAIPPEESSGSGGHYVEALATLAFVASVTERVGIGTGVLVLPYRPPLLTAKWAASIQMLSGGRLSLGVGVGWMAAEFRALGVARPRRGALTDEALEVLRRCFAGDEVELDGQRFLFLPRPERPPIFVGGKGPHALRRAARLADGWMPGSVDPDELRAPMERLRELGREVGRDDLEVVALGRLPLEDPPRARDRLAALAAVGVTRLALNHPYSSVSEFRDTAERVARLTD